MRTKVFAYKGWVGIESDIKAEGLLNDPMKKGQLGFVLDAEFVDISPEALELLKEVPKSMDSIGEVDIISARDNQVWFMWLGGHKKMFKPHQISASRDYAPSLIKVTKEVGIDPAFIKAIDKD